MARAPRTRGGAGSPALAFPQAEGLPIGRSSVLVVDDDELVLDLMRRALSGRNYEVTVARRAGDALEQIRAGGFDLVLLDVMLPGRSGLEVLRRIRAAHAMAELPVIMVTGRAGSEDTVAALDLGANDYVTKPLDLEVVAARVRNQLLVKAYRDRLAESARSLELHQRFLLEVFGRYLNDEVVTGLLEPGGHEIGGERRSVTVLIADLRGFTSLTESLGPSQVVATLNNFLAVMTEVVLASSGTIEELVGDQMVVVFGAPDRQERHALAAAACALRMQRAMRRVNRRNRRAGLPELEMGIGINSGEVVVGNFGSEKRAKYGVIGAPVNLAARIEALAAAGQVLVSQATIEAIGERAVCGPTFESHVKGFERPVELRELLGLRGEEGLALEAADVLVPPRSRLLVRFGGVGGGAEDPTPHRGELVRLSNRRAELRTEVAVAPRSELRLQLAPGEPEAPTRPLYARVLEPVAGEPDLLLVGFASVPPDIGRFLRRATGVISDLESRRP